MYMATNRSNVSIFFESKILISKTEVFIVFYYEI